MLWRHDILKRFDRQYSHIIDNFNYLSVQWRHMKHLGTDNESLIEQLLKNYGENPEREGLKDTPKRVAKMYEELLGGYKKNPEDIFKYFDSEKYEGVVKIENITFSSLCEHHLMPFAGTVDIAYKPNGRILGLSKFARLVEIYAKRLQVQERLTSQIALAIMENLHPEGCAVRIKAEHMCMTVRGVKKHGVQTTTICNKGELVVF